jgi:DNA-binding NarL/FixJ family response regulator
VVVFTSSNQPRDIDLALELGANSYLVKPSDAKVLVGLLQRVEDYWFNLNQSSPNGPAHRTSLDRATPAGGASGGE